MSRIVFLAGVILAMVLAGLYVLSTGIQKVEVQDTRTPSEKVTDSVLGWIDGLVSKGATS